jgi:cold shock CspA family protein
MSEVDGPPRAPSVQARPAGHQPERKEGQKVYGTVKRWDVEKGFGFVCCEDGGEDLFIHQSTVKVEGNRYRAIAPGVRVLCEYHLRDDKETALSCVSEGGIPFPGFASKLEATQKLGALASGVMYGSIKFMTNKGFGFIVPEGGGEDVFVHVQDVQSFQMLPTGTQVSYTTSTKRGVRPQAVHVSSLPQYPLPTLGLPFGGYADPYRLSLLPPEQQQGVMFGTIKWYSVEKGFGFIIPANGGPDIYFKVTDVLCGPPSLMEREEVLYSSKIARGDGHTVRAMNVTRRSKQQDLFRYPVSSLPPHYWPFSRPPYPY